MNLHYMQGKADRQRDEYDELLRERGELSQRLHDVEQEMGEMQQQAAEVEVLREVRYSFYTGFDFSKNIRGRVASAHLCV